MTTGGRLVLWVKLVIPTDNGRKAKVLPEEFVLQD